MVPLGKSGAYEAHLRQTHRNIFELAQQCTLTIERGALPPTRMEVEGVLPTIMVVFKNPPVRPERGCPYWKDPRRHLRLYDHGRAKVWLHLGPLFQSAPIESPVLTLL